MKRRHSESIAKYLYDVSKVTLTVIVLGNIASRERFEFWVVIWGLMGAFATFVAAFAIEDMVEEK